MSVLLCPAPVPAWQQCIQGILTIALSFPYQVTSLLITVLLFFVVKSYEPCVIGLSCSLLLRLLTVRETFDHQAVQIPFLFMAFVAF